MAQAGDIDALGMTRASLLHRIDPCPWPLLLALATASCAAPAANDRSPSLLPRPIETRSDAEPVTAPVAATPEPATDATVAKLRTTLEQTNATFATKARDVEHAAAAARGDAVGGERWITAQAALAELDALHATTSSTLTEIDDLAIARASDGKPAYPALDALRGAAQAASDAQSERIAAIQARLPAA